MILDRFSPPYLSDEHYECSTCGARAPYLSGWTDTGDEILCPDCSERRRETRDDAAREKRQRSLP